ncbi:MAG: hypothetical protein LBJ20_00815 [Candidatus Methanoplasma sp.]|jgi:hypothetical protein|nr:hypothetical protein [Candidatus Methanoplasma sp.]
MSGSADVLRDYLVLVFDPSCNDWLSERFVLPLSEIRPYLRFLEDLGYLYPYEVSLGVA